MFVLAAGSVNPMMPGGSTNPLMPSGGGTNPMDPMGSGSSMFGGSMTGSQTSGTSRDASGSGMHGGRPASCLQCLLRFHSNARHLMNIFNIF